LPFVLAYIKDVHIVRILISIHILSRYRMLNLVIFCEICVYGTYFVRVTPGTVY